MKFLVINGPNLNLLGLREPAFTAVRITRPCSLSSAPPATPRESAWTFSSPIHEGAIVDAIQAAYGVYDGIVINPAAYTHTSVAILDALKAVAIPAVEVHISDVDSGSLSGRSPTQAWPASRPIRGWAFRAMWKP